MSSFITLYIAYSPHGSSEKGYRDYPSSGRFIFLHHTMHYIPNLAVALSIFSSVNPYSSDELCLFYYPPTAWLPAYLATACCLEPVRLSHCLILPQSSNTWAQMGAR